MKTISNKMLMMGVAVVVVGLLIWGRGSGQGAVPQGPHARANNQAGARTQADGAAGDQSARSAYDFSLAKLGGGVISLSEFKGKKPVVVDFWASWCPNCRRDMPNLNRFYEKYKDKVEVIGVNLQEKESTVQNFINSRGISFPIALDPRGEASRVFGIQYTNTHFLIDINGNLIRVIPGDISEADITSLIN